MLKMKVNNEKINYMLQFFFEKDKNASQVAKILNSACDPDNYNSQKCAISVS